MSETNDQLLWYKDSIFYEVYIRAFADGNGDGQGDFSGLTEKLDYFRDLGVDCLWISPMYPSPLRDDGYDISDYTNIHPIYGNLNQFREFLAGAHQRGLKVIADLVLNHTSDQHPWFQSAISSRQSPFRDYYVWSDTDQHYRDARIIFLDTEKSNWTWNEQAGQYYWHRFYACQPDLNYDNPAVQQEMLHVIRFWLEMGLDGFRADAVPYLFERDGTNCENLPETHQFLKTLRRFVDENFPGRVLLAEANQWPEDVRPYFGESDEFQMNFHFPVMPRIFMALCQEDRSAIVDILQRTPPIPADCQWVTFLRNHDELTLEMVTEQERQFMWEQYAPEPRARLNLGIRRRLAPLLDNDIDKITLAYSLLFTLPGSPIIYYGDEIGMGDNIWLNDRDGVRTPMQWDASPTAGFSSTRPERFYSALISDERFGYPLVNVANQRQNPDSLWNTLRRMIAVRKQHQAFGRGDNRFVLVDNPSVLAYLRSDPVERILAVHNLSSTPRTINVDLSPYGATKAVELLNGWEFSSGPLRLRPHEFVWLTF
ncbi:MAG: maltose alpha-D-glucosyltransferase [Anaerolineaceae bacterium]|nr:maltose alpha-D-glucosyltransferase [Anaerolineaceae bacterium]